MANPNPSKPFVPGDARINRKGRPKSFDAARELAQQIAHETAKAKGGGDVVIEGHKATVIEMILRKWATSDNPQLQRAFVEYAVGKVPDRQEVSGPAGGAVMVHSIDLSKLTIEQLERLAKGEDVSRILAG